MDGPVQVGGRQRWPWLVGALLLGLAAMATVLSAWLYWLPCRGSMLEETLLDLRPGTSFSDACLRRMDGGPPFPSLPDPAERTVWVTELAALALVLTAIAWASAMMVLPGRVARVAGAACAALTLAMAAVLLAGSRNPGRGLDEASIGLWILPEVAALVVVLFSWADLDHRGKRTLLVFSWGATAFGLGHVIVDYLLGVGLSEADWDSPPGTGFGTALVLLVAAVATVVSVCWPLTRGRITRPQR